MSSDEEDFNDIYDTKDESKVDAKDDVKAEEKVPEAATSALDQLAALQASSANPDSNKDDAAKMPWETLQNTLNQLQTVTKEESPDKSKEEKSSNASVDSGTNVQSGNTGDRTVKADLSKDSCKMFIGGLNWETTEDGLRDYFSKYGKVEELKIMKDPATGRSRGFGFLTFESASSVDEVVKTQHILDGKVIDPKRAIPREEQDKTGKIFVGGIGPDVRPKEFEEFFAQWGTIIDAQLMLDKDTGRSRGFGFITYDTPDAVDKVCQNKFIDFKGRKLKSKGPLQDIFKKLVVRANQHNKALIHNMAWAQEMQEYFQKMQDYYKQVQQQGGMDYNQMYQQQMQQMAMMMPGFNPSTMGQQSQGSPDANSTKGQSNEASTPTPDDQDRGNKDSSRRSGGPGGFRGRPNDSRRGYHPYNR
ncbi:Eukaryotic RNA Recognition Motif (RRM) profile [Nakaseomyces glabratus]|nr:Eukaryotic RNA Recognition Motif (RRM) profile [Nakaseomyces glabratus]